MDLAWVAFRQIITMLVLMLIGVVCARARLIDDGTNKQLSRFLLVLINPLVILLSYLRPYEDALLSGLLISMLLGLVSFAVAIPVAHVLFRDTRTRDKAIERFSAVYPNAGFLGVPLVGGMFGSEGVFYITGYITIFFLLFWTHGVIVMSGKRSFAAIGKAFLSPAMVAIYLGFAIFILRIKVPEVIQTPLSLLANVNTPLAMIVAGVSISGAHFGKILRDKRILSVSAVRLLLLPALNILIFSFFDLPPIVLGTVIVLSACPIAANLIMFAYRYDRDPGYASELFAATTLLSLVTIPLVLWLVERISIS